MPASPPVKLTVGLSRIWAGFLPDWDRSLRAANHPETTRYNYLLAAAQLGRYLAEHSPDPDADAAADDPTALTRAHVETFQAWMIDTRSASTAVNKHKCLQQFFRFLLDENEISRSPMERVKQPKTRQKLIRVMPDEDTRKLLAACRGTGFTNLRDEALIRLYCNTGARLSEIGNLRVEDIDLNTDSVHLRGKGAKDRRVRFGPKTGRALSRYLRARAKHKGKDLPELWLSERGARPLAPNGIERAAAAARPALDRSRLDVDDAARSHRHRADRRRRADAQRRVGGRVDLRRRWKAALCRALRRHLLAGTWPRRPARAALSSPTRWHCRRRPSSRSAGLMAPR
jgi:integrase/recombinase XerC